MPEYEQGFGDDIGGQAEWLPKLGGQAFDQNPELGRYTRLRSLVLRAEFRVAKGIELQFQRQRRSGLAIGDVG